MKKKIKIKKSKYSSTFITSKSFSKAFAMKLIKEGNTPPVLDLKKSQWFIFNEETEKYEPCGKTKGIK